MFDISGNVCNFTDISRLFFLRFGVVGLRICGLLRLQESVGNREVITLTYILRFQLWKN